MTRCTVIPRNTARKRIETTQPALLRVIYDCPNKSKTAFITFRQGHARHLAKTVHQQINILQHSETFRERSLPVEQYVGMFTKSSEQTWI